MHRAELALLNKKSIQKNCTRTRPCLKFCPASGYKEKEYRIRIKIAG